MGNNSIGGKSDEECKRLLSNKDNLLNILKWASEPQLSTVNDGEYFEIRNAEDDSMMSELIIFDVMLHAGLSDSIKTVG